MLQKASSLPNLSTPTTPTYKGSIQILPNKYSSVGLNDPHIREVQNKIMIKGYTHRHCVRFPDLSLISHELMLSEHFWLSPIGHSPVIVNN